MAAAGALVRRGWRALSWYVKEVTGEGDYERYVAHLRRTHPGRPVPSPREFWRQNYAEQDANPTGRCC